MLISNPQTNRSETMISETDFKGGGKKKLWSLFSMRRMSPCIHYRLSSIIMLVTANSFLKDKNYLMKKFYTVNQSTHIFPHSNQTISDLFTKMWSDGA